MAALLRQEIAAAGGWLPFDRYMSLALYAPGVGYYANARRKFGTMPQQGSAGRWRSRSRRRWRSAARTR